MNVLKKIVKKAENSKIVKKPKFLVIGLIAIVVLIALIYIIFLKYSPIMNFKYEGYAISGKEITENLLGSSNSSDASANASKNIELTKIEEQGTIFKKLNDYFVGRKEKQEINLNYPIYINNNNMIYNLAEDTKLISKNFEEISGYPNLSISEGKIYDGNNLERADGKEYIFARNKDGIYINLKEIKINTTANEYVIPSNSIIAFEKETIIYYNIQENILVFNEIKDVDSNSQITIKNIESRGENNKDAQMVDNTYNYEELLTKLGIIENAKNDVEKEEIIKEDTSEKQKENDKEESTTPEKEEEKKEEENTSGYKKPEVTVEDFKAEVYTAKSNLNIKDPKARIVEAPTFEIYKEGKIYLRRIFKSSGEIQITGLVPETEYEIIGKYIYLNEENKKIENTFYKGTIRTKGYEELGTIELSKEEGEIYSNKIQIKNVKIISDLQNEAIKGINQIELETGNIKTVLKNNQVNELLQGKEIVVESSEGLKSNTKIDYEIKFYDKNGKELKVSNNKGKTRTAKQKPKVTIKIKEQDIVSVTLGIKLANKDNVKLENYKYIITRPNGEKLKEERLSENEREIKLEDLDQNQYYKIKVYADYDLSDNKGIQKDVEIGNLVFATKPISTLGSLEMIVENKKLTSKNAKISYKIDEDKTDKRLIQILNELTIKIVENNDDNKEISKPSEEAQNSEKESQHTNRKTTKEGTVIYTNTLTKEEIKNLQLGETKEINYENLKSNTKYTIEITGNVELGNTKEEVPVTYIYKEFTTLKIPAKVEIKNQFVTGNLIDLDVIVEDENNSVLNNKVRMELRDEKSNLIDLQEIETNKDWLRKTYEKLEENKTYTLSFYADQYNEGSTDETYKVNYLIKEIEILTEPGISGSVGLTELTKKATGKNLVDISSEIKWYVYPNFYTNDYYGKEYNEETEILTLGGHGNYRRAVYDLREYAGQEVTMSFKAKAVSGSQTAYIQNSKIDKNRILIQNLTEEWNDYKYTLVVDNTGYLGFSIEGGNGIEVKELQIELGNKKTSYEEFKYTLQSSYSINLEDKRDEIATNDYYIKIYEDNNLVKEDRYEEIPEENVITNAIKTYEVEAGRQYKVELTIKMKEREYVISSLEYDTKETEEIKGIYTLEEFQMIQPYGKYYILDDLKIDSNIRFGGNNISFYGELDFRGNSITKRAGLLSLIENIEQSGKIKNLVLNVEFPKGGTGLWKAGGLFTKNYGVIQNININLTKGNDAANEYIYLLGWTNFGTVDKFVVNYEEAYIGSRCIGVIKESYGTVKNGYIYGKNMELNHTDKAEYGSLLVEWNFQSGVIKNIYNLCGVDVIQDKGSYVSNYTIENYGKVENIYSVNINGETSLKEGPNVYRNYGIVNNSYYIYDKIFNSSTDYKTSKLALKNKKFQNEVLNSEGTFKVDEYIEKGYFPQLDMPDCMPKQEYIKLPKIEDEDLADIVSFQILEKQNDSAILEVNVYNPSTEEIKEINIDGLTCKIIEQKHLDETTQVKLEIKVNSQYVSSYSVSSLTVKSAYSQEYTRNYDKNERELFIEFFREINNVDDWKEINKFPKENYKIMKDIDFKNCGNEIIINRIFEGKLEGNNKTIKNISVKDSGGIINNLYGEVCNLTIDNMNLINNEVIIGGFIGYVDDRALVNNVHILDSKIETNTKVKVQIGALVGNAKTVQIINCSVTNTNIVANNNTEVIIGGLVGKGDHTLISNCFVQDIHISINNVNISNGIGGIVGRMYYGNIEYSYSFGNIQANNSNVAGICGLSDNSYVSKCYSGMNIESNGKHIAGITGYNMSDSGMQIIKNNLYIGNIYNKLEEIVNPIIGNNQYGNENFLYEASYINGEKYKLSNIYKLTKAEIFNKNTYKNRLYFGDNYNYEKLEEGILPKLNYKDTENLVVYQKDNILKEEQIAIEKIEAKKINNKLATVRVELSNPSNLEITKIYAEGLEVEILRNTNKDKKTYLDLNCTAEKFYDSYKIFQLEYIENGESKEQEILGKIDIQFFKEINNYQDWQDINEDTSENYILMTDIDLAGKINPKYNFSVNRLISNNGMHTIKNLNINSDKALIKDAKKEIKDVKFENITINNETNTNYIGIIKNNSANLNNLAFKDININAKKSSYVGCIGKSEAIKVDNITLNNIICNGISTVGGFCGFANEEEYKNIKADNIEIHATEHYIGGIFGNLQCKSIYDICKTENISIKNSKIIGTNSSRVGGIYGIGRIGNNIESIGNTIIGREYIGGITGDGNAYYNQEGSKIVRKCNIEGRDGYYIGGVAGYQNTLYNAEVEETTIKGNATYMGGIAGYIQNEACRNSFVNSKVTGLGTNVGGISGRSFNLKSENYVLNSIVEGKNNVGGIVGIQEGSEIMYNYVSANIKAINHRAGGIAGYLNNMNTNTSNNIQKIISNYVASTTVQSTSKVGGLIGGIDTELVDGTYYSSNFIEANIISENPNTISLGIGNMPKENTKLKNTYYYKYSKINNQYPTGQNEIFIPKESYLTENDLKTKNTYIEKLKWKESEWNFNTLAEGKYPIIKNTSIEQEGIRIPSDPNLEHIDNYNNITSDNMYINDEIKESLNNKDEKLQHTFIYEGKTIKTYNTYSEIIAKEESKVIRKDVRLYVKDGKLYSLPVEFDLEDDVIKFVENNFVIDSYNGKEYETVLGSDGKIYDLKEPLNYPENFVNKDVKSIGNNLNNTSDNNSENINNEELLDEFSGNNLHEMEVIYRNGYKVKFNYQTGEVISSIEKKSNKTDVFDYIKEKISAIGNSNLGEIQEITKKYEESKVLQSKLEETPVEEVLQRKNNNVNMLNNVGIDEINKANNSLKEPRYISIYNAEKDDYQIYQEEELLDTTKQEVISENEKIEANNLKEYYVSGGRSKNKNMGILWITLSIVGVVIILFAIKRRD